MENASSSDYMEVKKRKQMNICQPDRSASSYVSNKLVLIESNHKDAEEAYATFR